MANEAAAASRIRACVVYAAPGNIQVVDVELPAGATLRDAVEASGLLDCTVAPRIEEIEVGVYNHVCALDEPLRAGDRVEIYRALTIDPKEARRARARLRRDKPRR